MLIGLFSKDNAGKSVIAEYLIYNCNFQQIPSSENVSSFMMQELRWKENWVFFYNPAEREEHTKRPFFLLVTVDAPMRMRYDRFTKRSDERNNKTISNNSLSTQ